MEVLLQSKSFLTPAIIALDFYLTFTADALLTSVILLLSMTLYLTYTT